MTGVWAAKEEARILLHQQGCQLRAAARIEENAREDLADAVADFMAASDRLVLVTELAGIWAAIQDADEQTELAPHLDKSMAFIEKVWSRFAIPQCLKH